MRCIYEVTIEVDSTLAEEYLLWLLDHRDAIVREAGFTRAEIYSAEAQPPGKSVWVTQYHAPNRAVIDFYLQNLAPRFRADGVNRFGNRFQAQRRILIFQS